MKDIIFGTRAIIEALKSGTSIDKLLIKKGIDNELVREMLAEARKASVFIQYVPYEKLNKITTKNHQGVIAYVAPIDFISVETIIPTLYESGKTPFILVLDSITDVRNFGAICRTAECAGVHAIVIPAKGSAQIGADAVKTSSGALMNMPICKSTNILHTITFLKESGLKIVAASEKGTQSVFKGDYTEPLTLVFGSEGYGISSEILKKADEIITIPLFGVIASLNVSSAAAICMYEVVRQRVE